VDGSEQSHRAFSFAAGEWPEATFVLLHVIDPVDAGFSRSFVPSNNQEWYREALVEAESLLDGYDASAVGGVEREIEVGRPAETIVEMADRTDVDLVALGSHGRKGVQRLLLGSVSESVARNVSVPVTIVR
jgi:nucleotide-binding universal stress UspA family protein